MIKIHRFIFASSFLILTLRTLTSCETNSTADLKVQKVSNQKIQSKETETDTTKIELKEERNTATDESNFLTFSDFWKIVRTWSATEPNKNIKIQNQEFRFTNKRLETDVNMFVYVRKAPEATVGVQTSTVN